MRFIPVIGDFTRKKSFNLVALMSITSNLTEAPYQALPSAEFHPALRSASEMPPVPG
jgi:hypothetical protein